MENSLLSHNSLKEKLYQGNVSLGMFLLTNNSFLLEAICTTYIDWIVIDTEASIFSKEDILHCLQASNAYSTTPIIRIAEHNKHLIESSLDLGAKGIVIPKVDNKEEASKLTKYLFYPPIGERGINPIRVTSYFERMEDYFQSANDNTLVILQIESKESVANINEIASVENSDVLFIGCGDLASSFGQRGNVMGSLMDDARQKVLDACKKYNKIPGIFAYSSELATQYIKEGFKFIAIGNDIKILKSGVKSILQQVKEP